MSEQFKFRRAESDSKIKEVCGLSHEWFLESYTREEAGSFFLEAIKQKGSKCEVYYLEHTKTSKPVCMVHVLYGEGYYKDSPRNLGPSSAPDPETFGVKPAKTITLGYVFTSKEYKNLGLNNKLVSFVIDYIEKELINYELNTCDKSKPNNFAEMVTNNGEVDPKLANYYMGKKYFWIIYSDTSASYEVFGFKSYPVEFYKVPTTILNETQQEMLDTLMGKTKTLTASIGKNLRLLDATKPQDQELISFILQNKELEILTELNKLTFHSQLSGSRRSTSSFSSMTDALTVSKLASQTNMMQISETGKGAPPASGRRKSSIHTHEFPKFAMKPKFNTYEIDSKINLKLNNKSPSEEEITYNNIKGAIFSNDLQQKSHFILWTTILTRFIIIGVGELLFNMFGPTSDPLGKKGDQKVRGSSFTGLNELGGYNFQDLDILFSTACMVAKKKSVLDKTAIYVAVNDLPSTIPAPILNDYFLHYLPKVFDTLEPQDSKAGTASKVEFITDASVRLNVLPMLKKFGLKSTEFDLDWTANGMWGWGQIRY